MHPGGKRTNMQVARDGADPGTVAGDDPSEVRQLFQSNAHYFEPAGAVSWDVAMGATDRDWRIKLKKGDVVSISVTYNVKRGDWPESMGIMPVAWVKGTSDPLAKDPAAPGYEENENISPARRWVVPAGGVTLVSTGGHMHPGGKRTNMQVARDGADAGTVAGDDPSEIKQLFRSDAHYYEPAGAVSWDVSMESSRHDWRISLKEGDVVSISVTYNVKRGDWPESMGIMATAWYPGHDDPLARDPFDDADEVQAMFDAGGVVTHGHLPENADSKARKDLGLPDPRKLPSQGPVPPGGIDIDSFVYSPGGFSAIRAFPQELMEPVVVDPGDTVSFTNNDALPGLSLIHI